MQLPLDNWRYLCTCQRVSIIFSSQDVRIWLHKRYKILYIWLYFIYWYILDWLYDIYYNYQAIIGVVVERSCSNCQLCSSNSPCLIIGLTIILIFVSYNFWIPSVSSFFILPVVVNKFKFCPLIQFLLVYMIFLLFSSIVLPLIHSLGLK